MTPQDALAQALMNTDTVPMPPGWPGYQRWSQRILTALPDDVVLVSRDELAAALRPVVSREACFNPNWPPGWEERSADAIIAAIRGAQRTTLSSADIPGQEESQ